jgi:Flp pilus assembly pilin Flp
VTTIETSSREEAQTTTEYVIVLGVISPALILLLMALSDAVEARINAVVAFFS